MQTTTLGKTGLKVSRLGAGLNQIGGLPADDVKTVGRILGAALDGGVNFFDTAECYGNSEELIGKSVAHRRDEIVLATKAGHQPTRSLGRSWTGETVRDGIDRSLVRLRTDHVDLVQMHADDISAPLPDDVIQAALDAKAAGKTRFLGYSGENEDAEWAIQSGLFDTLQTSFNLVDQRARYGLFDQAVSKGIGVIAKRPIGNALWGIAATADAGEGLSGTDLDRFKRARAMLEMGPIDGAPQDDIVLALGFVLAHEEVDTAIAGTRSPEHMLANIEAVETELPIGDHLVDELRRRFDLVGREWPSIN